MFCLRWNPFVLAFSKPSDGPRPPGPAQPRSPGSVSESQSSKRTLSRGNSARVLVRPEAKGRASGRSLSRAVVCGLGRQGAGEELSQSSRPERRGPAPATARGSGVAAGHFAVPFIDSLHRARPSPDQPHGPGEPEHVRLFMRIITEERRTLSHQNICFKRQFLSTFGGGRLQARKLGWELRKEQER